MRKTSGANAVGEIMTVSDPLIFTVPNCDTIHII